ncbi:MAG: LysM peptidoglycan-binding domain-containing protein [Saprospiraceae bacterium]|nr:LysM peptidoglycan-binding domain-containing protein [Saprospiraceae bacterium]
MLRLTLFCLALLCLGTAGGQTKQPATSATAEKAPAYLTYKDTVLLTVSNGKKFIHHLVKPKQTLFSLAKYYGLSLDELYEHNPQFQTEPTLQVGKRVKIPVPNRAIKRYKGKDFSPRKYAPICYVVQDGDNLFNICKRYFDMPVDSIVKRNHLKNNNIKPGQLIHMGWISIDGIPPEWRPARTAAPANALAEKFEQQKNNHKEVLSQGVCFWQRDSKEEGAYYALHREAGIGTIMAITNPMSKRTVYVKVIGRIPAGYESNVEVVLAPAAARFLGARDPRFFVKLRFLK